MLNNINFKLSFKCFPQTFKINMYTVCEIISNRFEEIPLKVELRE